MLNALAARLRAYGRATYSASRQADLFEAADWLESLEAGFAKEKAEEICRAAMSSAKYASEQPALDKSCSKE